MASSGYKSIAATKHDTLKFSWSEVSQSIANNTTTIDWKMQLIADSYGKIVSSALKDWAVTVAGEKYSGENKIAISNNSTITLASGRTTIKHDADGTKTFSFSFSQVFDITFNGSHVGTKKGEGNGTLDTIPRATAPTLSENSVDMGKTVTIYMYRASDKFTHDLAYSFAGSEYIRIANGLDTVYYWDVPDLADKIPTKTSGTLTIRCITKNGSTTIGTKTVTMTVRVPDDVVPTISDIAVTEATAGLAAQFGAFVKDKSTLAVSITAAGVKGSTIKSYSTTLEGRNYTEKDFTTNVLSDSGEITLVTVVTDTRGRTARLPKKINVLDYYKPIANELTVYRVDENGNAKSDGKYMVAVYSYRVAPVNNKNTARMVIEYKRSTGTGWKTLMTRTDLSGAGTVKFDEVFTSDYQFDVKMTVEDWFGTDSNATYDATLPTAKVILDIKAEGDGLATGKTAEFPGFEIAMPASGESFLMAGVRNYSLGDAYGHILYNNGLLIQWGAVTITPTAVNTVASAEIIFPIPYKARPFISGTLMANTPQLVTWGMAGGTTQTDGLIIHLNRSTLHSTAFRWMAVGQADPTRLPEVTAE